MKPINLTKENLILFLIMLTGGLVRFLALDGFSLSADEVSALVRTNYDSFGDVLKYGVKENDMHPAGVQVFIYLWTLAFGYSDLAVRLPFILAGILSIFVAYRVARCWFNTEAALIATGMIAGLEYFMLYSEIARPYSPGLLFALISVYYWHQVVFLEHSRPKHYLLFGLGCLSAMYTHYYCFLFVALVAATGLIFIKRHKMMAYLITGVGIILLYLPHLSITLYQLDRGGLDNWLGPPDKYWIFEYIYAVFNQSLLLMAMLGVIFLGGLVLGFRQLNIKKVHFIFLGWFVVAFLIGFIYSREVSPILQHSVLLFVAPFPLMVMGDVMANWKRVEKAMLVPIIVTALCFSSSIFMTKYLEKGHFGVLEELSQANAEWEKEHPGDVTAAINVSSKSYMDFYAEERGLNVDYQMYTIDSVSHWDQLLALAKNARTDYFSYGWSTRSNAALTYELIKLHYPNVVDDRVYENSRVTLFSKTDGKRIEPVHTWEFDLAADDPLYTGNQQTQERHPQYGPCIHVKPEEPYGLEIKIPWSHIRYGEGNYLAFEFDLFLESGGAPSFVYEIEREGARLKAPNGEDAWYGRALEAYVDGGENWNQVVHARMIDPFIDHQTDIAKMYFWNNQQAEFYVRNFKIHVYSIPQP